MSRAYYNEVDPEAAQWLRNLIDAGEIAPGDVDERSIEDVSPDELRGYVQCHFFAGIGVWSHALRRAEWPDHRPIWTGSCPCQPFAAPGKGEGFADERHLWPAWNHLIGECRPVAVLGEQVATKDGLAWLDLVSSDLEGADYALGAFDLSAAGVGAPHIRQRLYIGAYDSRSSLFWLDHGHDARLEGHARDGADRGEPGRNHADADRPTPPAGASDRLADEPSGGRGRGPGPVNGFWGTADWLLCADPDGPAWRPVEPGTFPLDHGSASRVVRLRAYGNAIVAPLAEAFIRDFEASLREVDRGPAGMSAEDLLA